jgi:RimJ/RimL family protein N-acetyltransferase
MNLQPTLENHLIKLAPLKKEDFEILYKVASDPLVWEQHPNKERYKREVFQNFFEGAIGSGGAFLIIEKASGEVMGSSRFYGFDRKKKEISIGYTFLGRKFWGGKYNPAAKKLMMDHAFKFVDKIIFHVGAKNIRSQKAMEKLGAVKVAEEEIAYHGETNKLNFIYEFKKWNQQASHQLI